MAEPNSVARTAEEHYDEIDMLREERDRTLADYAAWEVYDPATGETEGVYADREDALEVVANDELSMGGLMADDRRLAALREEGY